MAVKIKLKRMGKVRVPQYRIIVADARTRRDGRAIEELGKYHPKEQPSMIDVDSERVQYWLGVGAQPTEPVLQLLKITGDWQRFKGLPGGEGRLQVAPAKADKTELFNTALAEAHGEPEAAAATPKKTAKKTAAKQADKADKADKAGGETAKPAKKSAAKKTTAKKAAKKAETPPAETSPAESSRAETSPAETSPAEPGTGGSPAAGDGAGEPASES